MGVEVSEVNAISPAAPTMQLHEIEELKKSLDNV